MVRTAAGVRAWENVCPHRGQPVDLGDGRLFAADGTLECQAHGAHFDPLTGACVRGPRPEQALTAVEVREVDGALLLDEDERLEDEE